MDLVKEPHILKWEAAQQRPGKDNTWYMPQNVTHKCHVHGCKHPDRTKWSSKKQCSTLRGHMEHHGNQRNTKCVKRTTDFNPRNFFKNFMKPLKPVVLKGIAKMLPAFTRWVNDSYWKKNCQIEPGVDYWCNIEVNKKVQRNDRGPSLQGQWHFCDFIDHYRQPKGDYYVASVPVMNMNLRADVPNLEVLRCPEHYDTWENIMLWMSNGGTISSVHFDTDENIMTSIDGYKETVLTEPIYSRELYVDFHNKYGLAPLDPEYVDVERYPRTADPEYLVANTEAGDALYIPDSWWHTIFSYERNVALTMNWHSYNSGDPKWNMEEQCHDIMTRQWGTTALMAYDHHKRHGHEFSCKKLRKRNLSHKINLAMDDPSWNHGGETMVGSDLDHDG